MKLQFTSLAFILSFISYEVAKMDFNLPRSTLQAFGMSFLVIAAIIGKQKPSQLMIIVISLASSFLIINWIMSGGHIAGLLNALFILFSFPLAQSVAKTINSQFIFWLIIFVVFGICLIGLISGSFSVTYFGDFRSNRLILGFQRPTFLCEAMLLVLIALYGVRSTNTFWIIIFPLFIAMVLTIQIQTGSRAGFGASLLFLYIVWEGRVLAEHKVFVRLIAIFFILIILTIGALINFDINSLNSLSSGRINLITLEVTGNLQKPLDWMLGNYNAQYIYSYYNERSGLIFHLDNFYAERLVSTGIIGLGFIMMIIVMFSYGNGHLTRAVVAALLFYGLFENGIFNITSGFASYTLILAAFFSRFSDFTQPCNLRNHDV